MSAAPQASSRAAEFAFSESDRAAVARMIYDEAGIVLPPAKAQLIYGRLAPRVRKRGLSSVADYLALIEADPAERTIAVDALTTNHTSFFREAHHFEHFMAEAWPMLEQRLGQGGRVRLWSAACSSGEEPYTLMLSILGESQGMAERLRRSDFKVLATDLSTEILTTARMGRYPVAGLEKVPASVRRWMRRDGDMVELHPAIRDCISYRKLNLLGDWPMRQTFDAIFCRNVMIYFDEPTKATLQGRLADQLVDGGFLYIGHSERLSDSVAPRFACVGRTVYQKVRA